ncbi:hypothetical protein OROHE_023631 [Orobanche hederae]
MHKKDASSSSSNGGQMKSSVGSFANMFSALSDESPGLHQLPDPSPASSDVLPLSSHLS